MTKRQEAVNEFMIELNRISLDKIKILIHNPSEIKIIFEEYYPEYVIQTRECLEVRILLKEITRDAFTRLYGQENVWDENWND